MLSAIGVVGYVNYNTRTATRILLPGEVSSFFGLPFFVLSEYVILQSSVLSFMIF